MDKHTPTPWQYQWVRWMNDVDLKIVDHKTGRVLAILNKPTPFLTVDEQEANAEFIVRAVNAHDELVAALKQALTDIEFYCERAEENPDTDTTAIELRRVLAKAEGSKNER
jgi:hypothetical protein